MQLILLLLLIILNGIFALSELAIVSASTAKLQQWADEGRPSAKIALKLAKDPNRFLSTVQIGITLIGIVAGAFGGSTLAQSIAEFTRNNIPSLAYYADEIGFAIIVSLTTYLSLVIGELVPKRVALRYPERMAMIVAQPMQTLSIITAPVVWFLSVSTEFISGLLGVRGDYKPFITDYDIQAMMHEGIHSGEFDVTEVAIVQGALELDDVRVREFLTPRTDMIVIDINDTQEKLREKLGQYTYSAFPISDGEPDNIIGIVRAKDLLRHIVSNGEINIEELVVVKPLFIPETVFALDVLRKFKTSPVHFAVVVDEHGGTRGIITLNDIVERVLGDVNMDDPEAVEREDGSWLVDGYIPIESVSQLFKDFSIPEDEMNDYNTIAGFALKRLGHVPHVADSFVWQDFQFEVIDMDGKRIDKLLITQQT